MKDGLDALRVASLQQQLPLEEVRTLAAVAPRAHHRRVATAWLRAAPAAHRFSPLDLFRAPRPPSLLLEMLASPSWA